MFFKELFHHFDLGRQLSCAYFLRVQFACRFKSFPWIWLILLTITINYSKFIAQKLHLSCTTCCLHHKWMVLLYIVCWVKVLGGKTGTLRLTTLNNIHKCAFPFLQLWAFSFLLTFCKLWCIVSLLRQMELYCKKYARPYRFPNCKAMAVPQVRGCKYKQQSCQLLD